MMRVENRVGPGTPDIHYQADWHSGWIESKYVKGEGERIKIRESQIAWMCDWTKHPAARCFIICYVAKSKKYLLARIKPTDRKTLLNGLSYFNWGDLSVTAVSEDLDWILELIDEQAFSPVQNPGMASNKEAPSDPSPLLQNVWKPRKHG